ncbi:MAG: AMP-binding protein [Bacteroidia bacterium]
MKISYSEDFKNRKRIDEIVSEWQDNSSGLRLKSSGTTASPKSISLSRALLTWSANTTKNTFSLGNEHLYCCLPIERTGGFMQLIRSLVHNWDVHFVNPSKSPLKELENNHKYSLISLTPYQLEHSLKNLEKLSRFKLVLIGGAKLSESLLKEIERNKEALGNTRIIETYGMTETASHIAYREVGDEWLQAVAGVQLSKVKDCLHLSIKELDLEVQTSDMIEIQENQFKLIGRADHVINSAGIKIHPEIIEPLIQKTLLRCGIERAFYLGKKVNDTWGEEAVLVLEGAPIKDEPFILEILYRELPNYQHPKSIVYVDQIERTDTGKIKRIIF